MGILKPKRLRLGEAPAPALAATWWFLRAHRFAPPGRLQPNATVIARANFGSDFFVAVVHAWRMSQPQTAQPLIIKLTGKL
jgi:hypothetical protein